MTEVRLQSFHYKLLNRIFPCNSNLYKWGIANSSSCASCGNIDTIEHHLYYCHAVLQFWKSLEQWVNNVFEVYIPLKITDIIFGIVHLKTQDNLIPTLNYLIIYAKWFVYISKKDSKELSFIRFQKYMKHILSIEQQIAINREKLTAFNIQWSPILYNLNVM